MALTKFKVTNLTQGRLELRPYKIVLDPHESTALVAPVAEEVNWLLGRKFVKIEPMISTKVQPFALQEPTRRPDGKKGRREPDASF
jgi:hypothetical protein